MTLTGGESAMCHNKPLTAANAGENTRVDLTGRAQQQQQGTEKPSHMLCMLYKASLESWQQPSANGSDKGKRRTNKIVW